jgi:CHAT domain-containing protein
VFLSSFPLSKPRITHYFRQGTFEFVVLSACDTGRGENLSGEGVFGLRRAFVQAGALNLMLTLWQVEDTFTKNLMLAFYRDYIQTGDAVGALSCVQRDLLTKNGPRFWAPFLVSVQGGEQGRSVGGL